MLRHAPALELLSQFIVFARYDEPSQRVLFIYNPVPVNVEALRQDERAQTRNLELAVQETRIDCNGNAYTNKAFHQSYGDAGGKICDSAVEEHGMEKLVALHIASADSLDYRKGDLLDERRKRDRPHEHLEAHGHQREQTETAVAAVLGDDIFISKIICLLGLHRDESSGVWTKKKHWTKGGCGQSCGCCRAHNIEDWHFGGCEACVDMWYLMTVNRQWMNLTKEFDGITETRSRGCNKKQRSVYCDPYGRFTAGFSMTFQFSY